MTALRHIQPAADNRCVLIISTHVNMIQESLRSLTKRISELGSVHESKLAFGLVMHLVLLCSKYYFKVYHSEFLLAYDRRSNGRTDVSAVSDRNEDRDENTETNKNHGIIEKKKKGRAYSFTKKEYSVSGQRFAPGLTNVYSLGVETVFIIWIHC